jgi:hypothetical protein
VEKERSGAVSLANAYGAVERWSSGAVEQWSDGGSSPGEKLSSVVVVAAEAVGRWRVVGRGPAFHNSAAGRVGRAIAA